VEKLADFCFPLRKDAIDKKGLFVWVGDEPCITFGKHAKARNGPCPMKDVPKDYWKFICDNDFPPDAKEIAAAALMGKLPVKGLLNV